MGILENAVVSTTSLFIIDSTNQKAENIPVNLSSNDISNNYRNTNFQLQGQYNIGNPKESNYSHGYFYHLSG